MIVAIIAGGFGLIIVLALFFVIWEFINGVYEPICPECSKPWEFGMCPDCENRIRVEGAEEKARAQFKESEFTSGPDHEDLLLWETMAMMNVVWSKIVEDAPRSAERLSGQIAKIEKHFGVQNAVDR